MNRQKIDEQMDGVISLVLILPQITYILMSKFIILIFLLPGFSLRTITGTAEHHQGYG